MKSEQLSKQAIEAAFSKSADFVTFEEKQHHDTKSLIQSMVFKKMMKICLKKIVPIIQTNKRRSMEDRPVAEPKM